MYKRDTFEASCPSLRSRFGMIETEILRIICSIVKMNCDERTKKNPSKWLPPVRLHEDERKKLDLLYSQSTSNSLSEYARDVLLKKPVNILYRNQSADEFLAEMILLKNELNAIGKNFNQVVHKLHTLDHVPEIKAWVILNESSKKIFMKKVEEIKDKVNEIYQQWSQK